MTGERRALIDRLCRFVGQSDLDEWGTYPQEAEAALRTLLAERDRMRELLARAVADRIDDEWLAAARAALGRTPPGGGG